MNLNDQASFLKITFLVLFETTSVV